MISLHEKIDRAERLLKRLEEDGPLLAVRCAELGAEHRAASQRFADDMIARTRRELHELRQQQACGMDLPLPAAAD